MLTSISWCSSHSPELWGDCAGESQTKMPWEGQEPCPELAASAGACSWKPRVLQGHRAAPGLPQGKGTCTASTQGCTQSRADTDWQSSRAAFYFYCFLQLVFLFPKQKQSVQQQWLYLSGNGDFCAAHSPKSSYASIVFHTVSLVQFVIARGSKISGLKSIWEYRYIYS